MPVIRTQLPRIAAAIFLAGLLGCATTGPPIPVTASRAEFDALVGEWDGTYSSRDTRRSGSIWFKLIAGEDHAHGDVLMTARDRQMAFTRNRPDPRSQARPDGATQVLSIRFVRAADGMVDGRLEPYWDPDCECEARTIFRGRLLENRLEGTFTTRLASGLEAIGVWSASKR
ncbi:MAG: hypothetical protein WBC51_20475 [Vicinamibacterales bacterium]|jgi:hypothetical protein